MAADVSSSSGVAGRYASALYDLAAETGAVAAVSADIETVSAALDASEDFARLVASPVFQADQQIAAIDGVAAHLKIGPVTTNFLKVVARNRRLFALPGMITAFRAIAAEKSGIITAEVTSAVALKPAQHKDLEVALGATLGGDVKIAASVDPTLIGGLVVKVGSRMIDTSLKTKLSQLKIALKEVG